MICIFPFFFCIILLFQRSRYFVKRNINLIKYAILLLGDTPLLNEVVYQMHLVRLSICKLPIVCMFSVCYLRQTAFDYHIISTHWHIFVKVHLSCTQHVLFATIQTLYYFRLYNAIIDYWNIQERPTSAHNKHGLHKET